MSDYKEQYTKAKRLMEEGTVEHVEIEYLTVDNIKVNLIKYKDRTLLNFDAEVVILHMDNKDGYRTFLRWLFKNYIPNHKQKLETFLSDLRLGRNPKPINVAIDPKTFEPESEEDAEEEIRVEREKMLKNSIFSQFKTEEM